MIDNREKCEKDKICSEKKRLKKDEDPDSKASEFLEWCHSMGIFIDQSKVKITKNATSHNYGMIAVKNINEDEVLARIPKTALLEPNTTAIKQLIGESKVSKMIRITIRIVFPFS